MSWLEHRAMPPRTTHSSDPFLQRVLADRYHLTQLLGRGAMGRVYLAEDQQLGRVPVAVKVLAHTLEDPKAYQRFEREAQAGAGLGHKSLHIVRVNDYGVTAEGIPFYVMEYVKGQSLAAILEEGSLSLARFLPLARHLALGLKAAHDGVELEGRTVQVVHRDLKPANVLVVPDDSLGEMAKLLDFGIAKLLSSTGTASITHAYVGTLAYSSPEQLEGLPLDPRSDLYSLGIIYYQMLAGQFPVMAKTDSFPGWYQAHLKQKPVPLDSAAPVAIPAQISNLVMACLHKDPNRRPQSAAEIISILDNFKAGHTASPPANPVSQAMAAAGSVLHQATQDGTRRLGASSGYSPSPDSLTWTDRLIPLAAGGLVAMICVGLGWGTVQWLAQDPSQQSGSSEPTLLSEPAATPLVSAAATILEAGIQAFEAVNYEQAVTNFEQALADDATSTEAQAWLSRAQTAQSQATPGVPSIPGSAPTSPTVAAADLAQSPELQGSVLAPSSEGSLTPVRDANTVKTFPVSIARTSVRSELGDPTDSGQGQWPNTVYDRYVLPVDGLASPVDLIFTYDSQSLAIEHTAAVLPTQSTSTLGSALLEDMLQATLPPRIAMSLPGVQQGLLRQRPFRYQNLIGVVEQVNASQVRIATWDAILQAGISADGSSVNVNVELGDTSIDVQAPLQNLSNLFQQTREQLTREARDSGLTTLEELRERGKRD